MKTVGTLRDTYVKEELLVIDDGSGEEWHSMYKDLESWTDNCKVHLKEENSGFSSTVNIGLARALAEQRDACLINADIEFTHKDWLQKMQETEADIIGAKLLYPNGIIQHAGVYFSHITRVFDHRFKGSLHSLPAANKPAKCPVTGALQYLRHNVLKDIGIYDEEFRMGHEDVDFMIRAIKFGHNSIYNPEVVAVHHESLFRGPGSNKVKTWELESFQLLLTKYKDENFTGIAPTMWEESE